MALESMQQHGLVSKPMFQHYADSRAHLIGQKLNCHIYPQVATRLLLSLFTLVLSIIRLADASIEKGKDEWLRCCS